MRRFFIGSIILSCFVAGLIYTLLLPLAQLDPAYAKSTHRAESLILGGSRAGQGLAPQVIQAELERSDVMLNFAFNGYYSPYGPSYYDLITRKLVEGSKDGLHILSVNPGILSDPADISLLREEEYRFYDMYCINMNPNLEFVLRDIGAQRAGKISPLLRLQGLKRRAKRRTYHHNGWAEIHHIQKEKEKATDEMDEMGARKFNLKPNPLRLEYLKKTIAYLKQHGQVVLVRLPAGPDYQEYEYEIYPHFEEDMQAIQDEFQIPYFNFFTREYLFHDRLKHHLHAEGARAFSRDLAQAIKAWQEENSF